ncbi:hypothetical protein [Leptolyngbya sp. 7M]|uniref:hypothetical protein n=1 Tax=Leptolyngbya sp. 7M TaxID=2812896 RepID=UPI001B8B7812|nr:hypothetical protein [Leptolyngbya sp. 7M]QYO67234.1 hypothetical protein JVX88_10765 [Leptolyngbya sp. 7M]
MKKPSLTIALALSIISLLVAVKPAAADVSIEIISRSDARSTHSEDRDSLSQTASSDSANRSNRSEISLNDTGDKNQAESQTPEDDFEGILIRI